ncbi:dipeptide transport ATP-binding protein DppF [Salmonella enterica subsp. arizonae]|uniref:Dipeptide transport ATP-binding protein DppF n=1 Tax=Salmonella enterica subsp. arizonae TaxID=59203 RepID=A0A379TQF9_SALER|nr:dipeptide transport ATP-binding protein DppF [Salmonella enterica subsp. arizonae]
MRPPCNSRCCGAIDLKKHYPVKKGIFSPERLVKALDGVSFNLERGKTLAVVGESGCGKSTLGRLLTMIETPTGGELYYQGQDLLKHDPHAQKLRRQKIQIVFQNPYGSLNPRKKVGQILEEPLLINTSLSKAQRREKAAGDDGEGGAENRALRPLSAYVLRWSAPAYRYRPRSDA